MKIEAPGGMLSSIRRLTDEIYQEDGEKGEKEISRFGGR